MASSASSVNRQVVRVGSLKVRNTAGNEFCPPSPYPVDVGEDTKLFDLVSDYLTFDLNIARARALRDLIPVAQRSLPPTPANPLSRFLSGGRSRSPSPVREAESFRALIREHFDPHHSFSLACDVELACYSTEGGSVRLIVRATPSDRLPFHYGLRLFLVHRGQEIKLRLLHHRVPDRFRARRITSQYTDDPEWIEVWSPTDHGCRFSKGHEEWSQAGELELVDADCSNPEFDSVSDRDRFVNLLWDVSLQCATQNCGTSREHLLTKKAVEETPRLALAVKVRIFLYIAWCSVRYYRSSRARHDSLLRCGAISIVPIISMSRLV